MTQDQPGFGLPTPPAKNGSNKRKRSRLASCILGVLIAGIIVFGCGGAFIGIGGLIFPEIANFTTRLMGAVTGLAVPETQAVSGNPARFDPIRQYDEVLTFAGAGVSLVGLDANYVQSDGTVDLTVTNYAPWVTYKFVRPTDPPADAAPIGTSGNSGGQWYEPIEVEAYQVGLRRSSSISTGGVRYRFQWVNLGLTREADDKTTSVGTILDAPRCSFGELWDYALSQDAPADAVAIIRYDAGGYDFSISSTPYQFRFDQECQPQ